MTASDTRERLASLLTSPMSALGLDVEAVDLTNAGKRRVLKVAVDKDGGITLDDVADATREISKVLDEDGAMGERPYTLEVSSPGVSRPLTLPRHWRRNVGRLVEVRRHDAEPVTGRITASDEDGAVLDVGGSEQRVEFGQVDRAKVQIEFTKEKES